MGLTVAEVLDRAGIDLSEEDIALALQDALTGMKRVPDPDSAALLRLLAETSDGDLRPAVGDAEKVRDERARTFAREVISLPTLTATRPQLAEMLGVSQPQVSRLAKEHHLLFRRLVNAHHYWVWQVHDGRLLPGVAEVTRSLPPGLNGYDVDTVMRTSHELLGGRTPIEWLATGGDPAVVIGILNGLSRW